MKNFLVKALLGLFIILVMGGASPQPVDAADVSVGKKMPEFTLTSLTNKNVTVRSNGKPIVLNFFATWCPPCRQEMPDFNNFASKYKSSVDLYIVDMQESAGKVTDLVNKNNYSLKDVILLDESGQVCSTFRVTAIPTTFIIDKNGVIRHVKLGAMTLKQLEEVVASLPK